MRFDSDRAYTGPTTAMRDAERLVKIDVTDVRAVVSRPGKSNLGIQIGAIKINLTSIPMYNIADRANLLLEHAVRRRICHHKGGQPIGVHLGFGAKIGKIDVTGLVAADHHNLHTDKLRRCWIGPVGRRGNQADIAL
jgi:hypothetical protein